MKETEKILEKFSNMFLSKFYQMELTIPVVVNGRLTRTMGRFKYRVRNSDGYKTPISIELSKYFVKNNDSTTIFQVLKHELVHYALFMKDEPNSDGHPHFENELKRLGVVSQDTIHHLNIKVKPANQVVYQCLDCKSKFKRRRRLSHDGKYHRCSCDGKLKNISN